MTHTPTFQLNITLEKEITEKQANQIIERVLDALIKQINSDGLVPSESYISEILVKRNCSNAAGAITFDHDLAYFEKFTTNI